MSVEPETRHKFVLVSDEDENETEVCTQCGAQRDRGGILKERATITGGWPSPLDCDEWMVAPGDAARVKGPTTLAQPPAAPVSTMTKVPEGTVEQQIPDLSKRLEELERFSPTAEVGQDYDGDFVRLSDVLNALPALRAEWEQELLSDEAERAAAKAHKRRCELYHDGSGLPTHEETAAVVIQAAISSTKKGADR